MGGGGRYTIKQLSKEVNGTKIATDTGGIKGMTRMNKYIEEVTRKCMWMDRFGDEETGVLERDWIMNAQDK